MGSLKKFNLVVLRVYITQQPLESIIFIDRRENNKNKNDAEQILKKNNKRT